MRIAINTQTPPIRFNFTYKELLERYGEVLIPLDLSSLSDQDYQISVGGVARMMMSLVKTSGFERSRWVALGPGYPPQAVLEGIDIHFIDLPPTLLSSYTRFKEGLYNEAHGMYNYNIVGSDYIAYASYNWHSALKLLEFYSDTDVYLINDFQQLLVGGIIGPSAPAVLWYHIPFVPERLSDRVREFLVRAFEGFDLIISSTKRDLEGLVRSGAKVKARQIYPFIDPSAYSHVSKSEVESVSEKFGIKEDDKVVLLVGRMDPIKSQDIAIKAIKNTNLKLVVAGNGSFTSKSLGHDKASIWARKLRDLVVELGVQDKVIFTGYVSDHELMALYQRSDVVTLTSRSEGFGLTICEAWNYKKPVVVSEGAGVSELIINGVNGYTFSPDKPDQMSWALMEAVKNYDKLGQRGYETLPQCSVQTASGKVKEALEEAQRGYIHSK
ncbi:MULTISPECIES: glycosyltransferase family 4 protein [Metallosphaera]|uniref:glycosyltransferase family 4 protein n=1 Tax=Metallosphaera TaxID=41980 RepID=UPI001F070711|nr:glycosyltransferase family 4 protein [Metallosphaera sedula]MCH1770031.1 glycosyltransferase family 4 protein [Metallosphaera sedula]MCP6728135.1 glycosyltransferase family 4 protein [Metallosphaera sedula]